MDGESYRAFKKAVFESVVNGHWKYESEEQEPIVPKDSVASTKLNVVSVGTLSNLHSLGTSPDQTYRAQCEASLSAHRIVKNVPCDGKVRQCRAACVISTMEATEATPFR